MKKLILFCLIYTIGFTTHAQKATWKEMNDFHKVMGATFHPSEEGNLQPLKTRAGELFSLAKKWQKSPVPQGYDSKVTKPILKKLVTDCKAIKAAVKRNKPDDELQSMIAKAHDVFHEIMEKCRH